MPQFPSSFPPKREIIETFDFQDIASGLGFEKFWWAGSDDSGGVKGILTNLSLISGQAIQIPKPSETKLETGETMTFDTSIFNLPRTVKGTLYIDIKGFASSGDAANVINAKLSVVDATAGVTDITSTLSSSAIDYTISTFELFQLALTQTIIKKGEKLRLTIGFTSTGGRDYSIEHNGSESFCLIPFRIEI